MGRRGPVARLPRAEGRARPHAPRAGAAARAGSRGATASRASSTARRSAWSATRCCSRSRAARRRTRDELAAIKGVPRGSLESRGAEHAGGGRARPGRAGRRAAALPEVRRAGTATRTSTPACRASRRCATRPRRGSTSTRASCARASAWRPSHGSVRRKSKSWPTSRISVGGRSSSWVRSSCVPCGAPRRLQGRGRSLLPRAIGRWTAQTATIRPISTRFTSRTRPCSPSIAPDCVDCLASACLAGVACLV